MGLPQIPEEKHRPSLHETVIDLLESIALEEMAISHLLNAEAEKIQAFVGACLNFPSKPKNHEIIQFNFSVKQLTDTLLMKEWLLFKKLETVTEIKVKFHCHDEKHERSCRLKKEEWDEDERHCKQRREECGEDERPCKQKREVWDDDEEEE